MNIQFQRRIDRFAGVLICRVLSLFSKKKRKESTGLIPRRILVILLSEMGSLVLAQPMFRRIREKYPDASVHVLLFEKNREILDIMEVIPPKNILTINDKSMFPFVRDIVKVLYQMRAMRFDTVIDCELFARVSSIFSFFSGASIRVGFHRHTMEGLYRGDFINRPVLYNPYHSIPEQFVGLVDVIDSNTMPGNKFPSSDRGWKTPAINGGQGWKTPANEGNRGCDTPTVGGKRGWKIPTIDGEIKAPYVPIGECEMMGMERRLYGDFPDIKGKRLVLLYPSGGILPIRAWPPEYFCKLAEGLISEGYAIGIIGLPADKELAQMILTHCGDVSCIDLTGYTKSIRELLLLFHIAELLITNDGGPGQFAVLTPIKSILFYGPETPALYGPLGGEGCHVFYRSLSCSPCLTAYNHRNSPCDGDNLCLKSIHPEEVLARALSILDGGSL
jgi:ADP-heptose:LPS heptosyltransferase